MPIVNGVSASEAAAARVELDAIRTALSTSPADEDVAVGNRSVPRLTQLLPRLGSATDSAWAYLALASAYGMAERPDRACEPYRNAKRLATTAQQRTQVDGLAAILTCSP